MKSNHFLIGCVLAVMMSATHCATVSAQTGIRKHGKASGLEVVSTSSIHGIVIAGLSTAERVEGESMSGWVGFMPYKLEPTTSVNEDVLERASVRPNPAQSTVKISNVHNDAMVTVISNDARILDVKTRFENGELILEVTDLPAGSYTAVIRSSTESRFARFVVSR